MGRTLFQDLRFARRTLRKNLTFTATIVLTLALAIGASTVIFSVVNAVLLNPLSYKNPDRIYRIYTVNADESVTAVGRQLPAADLPPGPWSPLSDWLAAHPQPASRIRLR